MKDNLLTLAIETSCDETAAAVTRGRYDILSNVVASQHDLHGKYGGIVPELACRRHVELIQPVVEEALEKAGTRIKDIELVAVTRGPGLVGALLVGLSYAKALAWGRGLPLVGVNHLEGHIAAIFATEPKTPLPVLALLVSGGHTELFLVKRIGDVTHLGGTRDDAAGEAFDKVAKMLDLGYPGGPKVEKMAAQGTRKFRVPIAMTASDTLDFSFSGPKTAVKYLINGIKEKNEEVPVKDICHSFQESVVDALINKTRLAIEKTSPASIAIAGGVACNTKLRRRAEALGKETGLPVITPDMELCSDNAAMVGVAGVNLYLDSPNDSKWMDYLEMDADPGWLPG